MENSSICPQCKISPRQPWTTQKRRPGYCKKCSNRKSLEHYAEHRGRNLGVWKNRNLDIDALISARKSKPCLDCKREFPPYAMEFDHRDPTQKLYNVATMRRSRMAFTLIEQEMAKCDVVCATCHKIREYGPKGRNPARYVKDRSF